MNSQFLTTFALMKAGNKIKVIMQRSEFVLFNLVLLLFAFMGIHGCTGISDTANAEQIVVGSVLKANSDTIELKRGDILVRPNLNLLPGSSFVANGKNFGHAALVVKGINIQMLIACLPVQSLWSQLPKDVPAAFQVREINTMVSSRMEAFLIIIILAIHMSRTDTVCGCSYIKLRLTVLLILRYPRRGSCLHGMLPSIFL
ncbi:MAG: hypothetical protein M9948_11935 [Lentimicrobium sp.]|nr:hypothetical protein [Lentimicrobium sp.]